jgi:hypothetical protein
MIDWIMRAKMSVPPPAPAVTTNSTDFDGVKASTVPGPVRARATLQIGMANIVYTAKRLICLKKAAMA